LFGLNTDDVTLFITFTSTILTKLPLVTQKMAPRLQVNAMPANGANSGNTSFGFFLVLHENINLRSSLDHLKADVSY